MLSFLASFCSEFLCCFIFCILISHSCIPSYKLNLIFLSSKDLQVGFFHHALVNSLWEWYDIIEIEQKPAFFYSTDQILVLQKILLCSLIGWICLWWSLVWAVCYRFGPGRQTIIWFEKKSLVHWITHIWVWNVYRNSMTFGSSCLQCGILSIHIMVWPSSELHIIISKYGCIRWRFIP